jgi:hypothetical protein
MGGMGSGLTNVRSYFESLVGGVAQSREVGAELHNLTGYIGESIILSSFIVSDYFSSLPYPYVLPPV